MVDSKAEEETSGFATTSGNAGQTLHTFTATSKGFNTKVTLAFEPNHDLNA